MKKTFAIAALAAVTATLGFAGSANASPFDNVNARQAQLQQRIDMGQRMHRLSFGEVRSLNGQMRNINFVEASYRRGGMSFAERADLNRRLDRVSFELQRDLRR